jgi:hypothetical protein
MDRPFDVVRCAVQREFTEWPTVSLTLPQACRYWDIESSICARILDELVEEGFLVRRADGRFARLPIQRSPPQPRLHSTDVHRVHEASATGSARMAE